MGVDHKLQSSLFLLNLIDAPFFLSFSIQLIHLDRTYAPSQKLQIFFVRNSRSSASEIAKFCEIFIEMCKYNTRYTTSSWQFLKECKRASCRVVPLFAFKRFGRKLRACAPI